MGRQIDKWLKVALGVAGLIALLVFSAILGTRIERDRQAALELQKERVSVIAVVNMDNGVQAGDEQINYASQLMSFPNDHFLVTGLSDAKAGIENGTYAAYVVIPETFSESVTSIENEPQKVTLVYRYNSKLVEEAEIQAITDINDFIVLLNSNIAYMYVDAILNEFHRIQDDSSAILENDSTELERLASVNAAKLIAVVEPVEEMAVNNEIQPVELTTYTTQNDALLDYLLLGYLDATRRGKDDYMAIRGENTEVMVAADSFLQAYDTVIQDTVTEQSKYLVTGRDKLAETIGLYNGAVDAQETELRGIFADIINKQLETDRAAAEIQLQKIVADIKNRDRETLEDLQEQWKKKYQNAQEQWRQERQDLQEQWEIRYQETQEQWEEKYQEAQEQWEKKYQELKDQCNNDGQSLQDLQEQWEKVYQDLQKEAGNDLSLKTETCGASLEQLVRDIYIQGYNDALDDLNGQIDSMRDETDAENIAVGVLQAALEQNRMSEPLTSETETKLKSFNTAVHNHLSGITIDWSKLNVTLPTVSGNESVSGGDASGGGNESVSGGDASGGGNGSVSGGDASGGGNGSVSGGDASGGDESPGGESPGGENPGGESPGEEDPGEEFPGDMKPGDNPEEKYEITLTTFSDEEMIGNAVKGAMDLFKLESESQQVNGVIQTYFIDALSKESERQMGRLSDAKQMLSQSMEDYEDRLAVYDPMQYIENANLVTYLDDIETNTGEMLSKVRQNNSEYMVYAAEMYSSAAEHTTRAKSSLDAAYTKTAENVKGCIDDLILSRTETNSQNVEMLEGFTNSLKYTRVESQGNAEVYDYIVNPVVSRSDGQAAATANTTVPTVRKENPIKIGLIIVLGVGILLCLAEVIYNLLRQQNRRQKKESQELF